METKKTTNEICEDKEHKGVFSMKLGGDNFVEYMGGEFTLWNLRNGELENPQKITTEKLEQLKRFIAEMEVKE